MSEQDLRALLTQLHTRLGSAQSLDAESRRHLTTTLHEIEAALARADAPGVATPGVATPGAAAPAAVTPPQSRLEALAVKFEADHPQLADTMRQLSDLLGKAGI